METSKYSKSNELFGLAFLQYRPSGGKVCRLCVSVVETPVLLLGRFGDLTFYYQTISFFSLKPSLDQGVDSHKMLAQSVQPFGCKSIQTDWQRSYYFVLLDLYHSFSLDVSIYWKFIITLEFNYLVNKDKYHWAKEKLNWLNLMDLEHCKR